MVAPIALALTYDRRDADTMRREIDAFKTAIGDSIAILDNIRSAYRGGAHARDKAKFLENRVFEYVSVQAPKTVSANPRVLCETAEGNTEARKISAAMQAGLNQWVADTSHGRFLSRIAQDFYSGWCGVHIGLEAQPGLSDASDAIMSPVCSYIDPHDLFWDHLAPSWESRLWSAHRYPVRVPDLLARAAERPEEGWDVAAIRSCAMDVDAGETGMRPDLRTASAPMRDEIVAYDVWYPERGGKSTLYTIAIYGDGRLSDKDTRRRGHFLRKPRTYDGPMGGPHVLFASRWQLGTSLPLSPIMVAWEQLIDLNAHARAISRAAQRRKKIGVVNVLATSDGANVKNAIDGEVVTVQGAPNGSGWISEMELGGLTDQMINAWQFLNARADRLLGFDDADRGVANAKATATAVQHASEAAATRTSDLIATFEECDRQVLDAVAYYMLKSDRVRIPIKVGDDERKRVGIPLNSDVVFRGGGFDGDPRRFGVKIERYSMQRVTDALAQRRAMDLMNLAIQYSQVAPQMSQVIDVEWLFDTVGDYLNIPDLGRIVGAQQAADLFAVTGPDGGGLPAPEQSTATMPGQLSGPASTA